MATESPRAKYRRRRDRIDDAVDQGRIDTDDYDAITEFLDAYDGENMAVPTPADESGMEPSSLETYAYRIQKTAEWLDTPLLEATTDDVNALMTAILTGDHPDVKDGGYANSTVRTYQAALRTFYNYHDGTAVEPDEITIADRSETPVDHDSILTGDEFHELRDAAANSRDLAIIDLLAYTGQRIRAIQTLRIQDINPDKGSTGEFTLNDQADGLKSAEGKRPLLGAQASVRDWLKFHPCPDDGDGYLITGLADNNPDHELGDQLHQEQIRRRLRQTAERAGIDKPVNPHAFRHFAVTTMYRDYNLDLDQIRWMIGHDEGSRVMETTYRHLTDADRGKEVEVQAGFSEPSDDSPLTPPTCFTCDEPLPDDAKYCSNCGHQYAPDAKTIEDTIEGRTRKEKEQAETLEEYKDADAVAQAVEDDPKFAAQLMDKLGEMVDQD